MLNSSIPDEAVIDIMSVLKDATAKPAPKFCEPEEMTDRRHAEQLAETVRTYWRMLGYEVDVDVEIEPFEGRAVFNLKSDLVGGLPSEWSQHHVPPPMPFVRGQA